MNLFSTSIPPLSAGAAAAAATGDPLASALVTIVTFVVQYFLGRIKR